MKTKVFLMLLVCLSFMGSGKAGENLFNLSGKVKDSTGKGISGVVVNDGVNFTKTYADGSWELQIGRAHV